MKLGETYRHRTSGCLYTVVRIGVGNKGGSLNIGVLPFIGSPPMAEYVKTIIFTLEDFNEFFKKERKL